MKAWKRGSTNVVATMLIFSLMIASMAVLYSRISPTLFGFQAESEISNQEFVLLAVANSAMDMVSSAENSQNRVVIISNGAIYSVNKGHQLVIDFRDNTGSLTDDITTNNITATSDIGSFTANISTSYVTNLGTDYYGGVINENSFISTNTSSTSPFVPKVEYSSTEAKFSLYFRSRIDISKRLPDNSYDVTIIIVKIDFNANFIDFPIELDTWSLRIKRKAPVITTFTKTNLNTQLTITQSVNGVSKTSFSFPGLGGENINVKIIEIPLLFSI